MSQVLVSPSLAPTPEDFFTTPIGQHGQHIKPKNLKHSWTKWCRDINLGLQDKVPDWTCQVCGTTQPVGVDPFIFPISDREYLRICDKCENKRIKFEIKTYEILIIMCRKVVS